MRKHIYITSKDCECNENPHCNICVGDLAYCKICNGSEGTIPTECPGRKMTSSEQEEIYAGQLDFFNNAWWSKKDKSATSKYKIVSNGTVRGTKVYSPNGEFLGLINKMIIRADADDDLIFADITLTAVEIDMDLKDISETSYESEKEINVRKVQRNT